MAGGGRGSARSASRQPMSQGEQLMLKSTQEGPIVRSTKANDLIARARQQQEKNRIRSSSPFKGSKVKAKSVSTLVAEQQQNISVVADTSVNQSAISHNQPFASPQSDIDRKNLFNVTDTDILAALEQAGSGGKDVEFASAHGSAMKNNSSSQTPFFSPEKDENLGAVNPAKSPPEQAQEQYVQVSRSVNQTPGQRGASGKTIIASANSLTSAAAKSFGRKRLPDGSPASVDVHIKTMVHNATDQAVNEKLSKLETERKKAKLADEERKERLVRKQIDEDYARE